jgi:hypothetical protein
MKRLSAGCLVVVMGACTQAPVEPTPVVILPEGEWPDWVTWEVPLVPGPEAVWPGVALYLNHQMPGDWLEIGEVSVKSF